MRSYSLFATAPLIEMFITQIKVSRTIEMSFIFYESKSHLLFIKLDNKRFAKIKKKTRNLIKIKSAIRA